MICLRKDRNDPWFNLAAEEFAVKHLNEEVLMIWESECCIVTGKHQLAYAEINPELVFGQNIPVLRRISGGGTVVHAPGNLNFTLITDNGKSNNKIDFRAATQPIIDFLKWFGLKVELTGISNLSVNGLKISGNAAHVFKNRSLHHGTLLFNADLSSIHSLIKRPDQPYKSKAIQSNPAPIANIAALSGTSIEFDEFKYLLEEYLIKELSISDIRSFAKAESEVISQLAAEKYYTDAWNFFYSPDYSFKKTFLFKGIEIVASFEVHRGIIKDFNVVGDERLSELNNLLLGVLHTRQSLTEKVFSSNISDVFSAHEINQLLLQLF